MGLVLLKCIGLLNLDKTLSSRSRGFRGKYCQPANQREGHAVLQGLARVAVSVVWYLRVANKFAGGRAGGAE